MRLLVPATFALATVAVADDKKPEAEPPPPPAATLNLVSGTSGTQSASWMYGYFNEACEARADTKDQGKLATFNLFTKGRKDVQVGIGARYYVLAVAKIEPPVGADNVGKTECRALVSFVPEDKHTYEITHDLKARKCPLIVKDVATGAEVSTFQKHKPAGKCKDV